MGLGTARSFLVPQCCCEPFWRRRLWAACSLGGLTGLQRAAQGFSIVVEGGRVHSSEMVGRPRAKRKAETRRLRDRGIRRDKGRLATGEETDRGATLGLAGFFLAHT